MLIINTEHYVRGLAAQGSTKIENGVRNRIHSPPGTQSTDRFIIIKKYGFHSKLYKIKTRLNLGLKEGRWYNRLGR